MNNLSAKCWLQEVCFLAKLIRRFGIVWIESFWLMGIVGTCVSSCGSQGRIGLEISPTFHGMISTPGVGFVCSTGSYPKSLRTLRTLKFSLKTEKNMRHVVFSGNKIASNGMIQLAIKNLHLYVNLTHRSLAITCRNSQGNIAMIKEILILKKSSKSI